LGLPAGAGEDRAAMWCFMAQGSRQEGAGWKRLEELARQEGAGCERGIGDLAWPDADGINPGIEVLAR